jgi:hypothetical protein
MVKKDLKNWFLYLDFLVLSGGLDVSRGACKSCIRVLGDRNSVLANKEISVKSFSVMES